MPEAGVHQEAPAIPTTDDPKEFFARFRESKFCKDSYERYFQEKTLKFESSETEEEKQKAKDEAFLESDDAKSALLDFAEKELKFKYNYEKYTPESRSSINEYVATVEDLVDMIREGASQHEIATLDGMRFLNHIAAAKQLVKDGIAPTEKMGRALVRLILVDKRLDTMDSAREPDIKRLERKLGV